MLHQRIARRSGIGDVVHAASTGATRAAETGGNAHSPDEVLIGGMRCRWRPESLDGYWFARIHFGQIRNPLLYPTELQARSLDVGRVPYPAPGPVVPRRATRSEERRRGGALAA